MNNALLDTYQLKSLDAVLEVPVERMKIRRRRGKLYVHIDGLEPSSDDSSNASDQQSTTVDFIPGIYDNFPMREPYDRVIRCLGFKFNESLFSQ